MEPKNINYSEIIIVNIIYGLLFIPSLLIAPMSFMASDGMKSIGIKTRIFIGGMFGIPILIILAIILSNVFYFFKKYRLAKILLYIPLFWVVGLLFIETFSIGNIWKYFTPPYTGE